MLRYFKRKADATEKDESKRSRGNECNKKTGLERGRDGLNPVHKLRDNPLTIVSWNANGFGLRLQKDWADVDIFLRKYSPDCFCIQEARLPAHCGFSGAKKGDGKRRYRNKISSDTKKRRQEKELINKLLRKGAFNDYKVHWSLSDSKYAGTAVLVKKNIKIISVSFCLPNSKKKEHHVDGRIILIEFQKFFLLNTYAPNNGMNETSFARRREWDQQLLSCFKEHFCEASLTHSKPLIW